MLEILVAATAGRRVHVKQALKKYIGQVSFDARGYRQERYRDEPIGRSLLVRLADRVGGLPKATAVAKVHRNIVV